MKRTVLFTFISVLLFSTGTSAQTTDYWVFYEDKNQTEDLYKTFDKKAINRRNLENIDFDFSDFPVNIDYEKQVSELSSQFLGSTKWFNASYVKATDDEIYKISNLDFVKEVKKAMVWEQNPYCKQENTPNTSKRFELLRFLQLNMFRPAYLRDKNLTAKGVRIAILDGGFPGVNTHKAFKHLYKNNQIIDTYDFVKDEKDAYKGISHGTMVLSCVAGMYHDKPMGLAQDAEFLLARTEQKTEPFIEEVYWLRAMEWADEKGADLINSSLGYTYHRYFQSDMDGKTSLVSQAANKAAEKGILVINAAGNEGEDKWHVIGTPADADSIISVGGVKPNTKLHISFSSYGPTADGRLKPNLCASGKALVANDKGSYTTAFGTSFASPLLCGFAACAKQAFPELSVMELKAKLESSGNLYPYFDYAHGYGIPDAKKLLEKSLTQTIKLKPTKSLKYIDKKYAPFLWKS